MPDGISGTKDEFVVQMKKITKETVLAACNNYDTVSLRLR